MSVDPSAPRVPRPRSHGAGSRREGPGPDEPQVSGVRPYFLTGGRARPVDTTLHIETQVLTTWDGRTGIDRLNYEHRDIISLCMRPVSVAEIAAHLRLHLGVARVIVADLVALGYLVVRQAEMAPEQEVHIIERVIRGLTAIR
jgi:hypothetical protein